MPLAGFFARAQLLLLSVHLRAECQTFLYTYDGEIDVAGVQVEPTPSGDA